VAAAGALEAVRAGEATSPLPAKEAHAVHLVRLWIVTPTEKAREKCRARIYTPPGLWRNGDDRLHLTRLAASRLVSGVGFAYVDYVADAVRFMADPRALGPRDAWQRFVSRATAI
jgi:hypothetical protein